MVNRRLGKLWLFLLALCLGVLSILSIPFVASTYHLEAAERVLGTPSLALAHLHRAVRWQPANAQAYRVLAQVYRLQDQWSAAAEAQERYTQLRPANPLGHMELAEDDQIIEAEAAAMQGAEPADLEQEEVLEMETLQPQARQGRRMAQGRHEL